MEGADGLKKVAEALQLPIHGLNDQQPDRYVLYQTITDALLDQLILVKPSDVSPDIPAAATSPLLLGRITNSLSDVFPLQPDDYLWFAEEVAVRQREPAHRGPSGVCPQGQSPDGRPGRGVAVHDGHGPKAESGPAFESEADW